MYLLDTLQFGCKVTKKIRITQEKRHFLLIFSSVLLKWTVDYKL